MQGFDVATVEDARASVIPLVEVLKLPEYAPLHELLRDRRALDVLETSCALAVLVQPFDAVPASA